MKSYEMKEIFQEDIYFCRGLGIQHVCKKVIQLREEVEQNILWEITQGDACFFSITRPNKGHYIMWKG